MTKELTWIVQKNMFRENGYEKLVETIERLGMPHISIDVVPFSRELIPEVEYKEGLIAFGSTGLSRVAIQRKWSPGIFFDEYTFTAPAWNNFWGENMLNYKSEIVKFKDLHIPKKEYRFIRPVGDLKLFSGHVIYADAFEEWRDRVTNLEANGISPEALCVVAHVQRIAREYRFFVVDRKVVSGSIYKMGENVIARADVEPFVAEYAQKMVDIWQPADAFVIDVAWMHDSNELKVIEVNCLNSAGFYACDASKIVQALYEYYQK